MWRKLMLFLWLAMPVQANEIPVDLELVLAVDASRSMDRDELALQREGYAAALEHPALIAAIRTGSLGRIALTYFDWGGFGNMTEILPWTLITSEADLRHAAATLRASPAGNLSGTGISGAITTAITALELNDYAGTRRIIDISGDGPNNEGLPVITARNAAAELGIQINGLPIMIKRAEGFWNIRDLDYYYEDCVITGPAAFVVPVLDRERLVSAILQKLVLEIAGLRPQAPVRLRNAGRSDCMIGERLRRERDRLRGGP